MSDNPVARFVHVLRESQWAPPRRLMELQDGLIERLVRHAVEQTTGYAERLRPVLRDGRFDFSRWPEVPILTRTDLQDRQHLFRARSTPEAAGAVVTAQTSGSTGRPMEFVKSALMTNSSRAQVERAHDWAEVDRSLPYAIIAVNRTRTPIGPEGQFHDNWSWMGGNGRLGKLPIEYPLSVQIPFLDRLRPAYLKTMPTNAAALARHARGQPWSRNLRHVLTYGETLTQDQIDGVREAWGIGVSSFYGSEEAGQIASLCPHSGMYHVAAESTLVEVLRTDGTPCEPGETGRVVVTPFYNYAMPLIRYEQGDYAELSEEPCGCGRTLPTIRRIMGRSRDMFVLPSGDRVWPRLPEAWSMPVLPALQRQVVQHAPDLIEVRYVHDGSEREADEPAVQALIERQFGPGLRLKLTRCEAIARSPGGKFREFVSLVA